MSRRQVRSTIRWESVIIALFGTVLGLVIGLFFGWASCEALHDQGFTKFSAAPAQLIVHRRVHRGRERRLAASPARAPRGASSTC